jgi:hypothetical protein
VLASCTLRRARDCDTAAASGASAAAPACRRAGLWEFPLQQVPAGAKKAQLQQAASSYLASLLGVELEAEGPPYQQQLQEGEGEQGDGSKESGGGGSGE